jgi:methylated-DNA-[protein]-cysteine S-methyltransferase
MTVYTLIDSPIGELLLAGSADGVLQRLSFGAGDWIAPDWVRDDEAFVEAQTQLREYFAGTRQEFDVALEMRGTEWQRHVWETLTTIPYGETRSYGQIATVACLETGPHAARAVGAANGRNPVAIIVPCHRVIGANGSLVGFGGGLEVKRQLLDLEAGRLALL